MRIVAVIAAFVLLLFTVVLEVVFITGGVRMHRRFGNHLKGVWLQLCAAAFVILFVGFAVLLYRYRGAFWLLEPPGALLVVYLYGIFIFFFVFDRSERSRSASVPTDCDYIIVLGAGLVDGRRVTRLLADRVDKGIEVYEANGRMPFFIMSGGQGRDEKVTEAEAMREYALGRGVPDEQILKEERSTSTRENLQFSRQLMESRGGGSSVFVTNEFHCYRTSYLARRQRFDVKPVASITVDYSFPGNLAREFLVVFKLHARILAVLLLAWLVLSLAFG